MCWPTAEVDGSRQVKISVRVPDEGRGGEVTLFRSTRDITPDALNAVRYPITTLQVASSDLSSGFIDAHVAHNVTYYYAASFSDGGDGIELSNVISVSVGDILLPPLQDPEVLIDKVHYVLEVWDRGAVVKSFPVILGRDPVSRKLHQDFRTTPEGSYRITYLKRNSTFHRALDIDYPNRIDRIRYDFLRSQGRVPQGKNIGGEIQVHGQLRNWALERNWTWGCIALRNGDIEEIFDHPDIKKFTSIPSSGHSFFWVIVCRHKSQEIWRADEIFEEILSGYLSFSVVFRAVCRTRQVRALPAHLPGPDRVHVSR